MADLIIDDHERRALYELSVDKLCCFQHLPPEFDINIRGRETGLQIRVTSADNATRNQEYWFLS